MQVSITWSQYSGVVNSTVNYNQFDFSPRVKLWIKPNHFFPQAYELTELTVPLNGGKRISTIRLVVLIVVLVQCRSVTNRQTDGQADRLTKLLCHYRALFMNEC